MKSFQLLIVLCLILLAVLLSFQSPNSTLKSGNITFVGFDANENSFRIKVLTDITSNTNIQFTDSEWNGVKFGLDENNIIWNTGEQYIPTGTVIHFTTQNNAPFASIGTVDGMLKISKDKDAIFAYIGLERVPRRFLAAVANHTTAFGTLANTGLELGKMAVVLDKGDQKIMEKISDLASLEN